MSKSVVEAFRDSGIPQGVSEPKPKPKKVMITQPLPEKVWNRIKEMRAKKITGSITLEYVDGDCVQCHVHTSEEFPPGTPTDVGLQVRE